MTTSEDYQDASTDYGVTQRQAENIADLAARRAQERLFAEVGRTFFSKLLLSAGLGLIAAATYLSGWFHIGPPK